MCGHTLYLLHSTVDDEPIDVPGLQSNGYPPPQEPTAAAIKPSPLPPLNSRPRLPVPHSMPKVQSPADPSRLQQQLTALADMDVPEGEYETPVTVLERGAESLYHTLTPPDGEEEDLPGGHYEEMDIDDEELSRNPPPVWPSGTAPPLPPSRPQPRKWKRSLERNENYSLLSSEELQENGNPNFHGRPLPVPPAKGPGVRNQRTANLSPIIERRKPPAVEKRRPPPTAFERSALDSQVHNHERETRRPASYEPGGARKPLPPPKPQTSAITGTANQSRPGMGFGFNVKNDPRFTQKLEERRQELYGVTDSRHPDNTFNHQNQPGGDYPQENYEEVAFTTAVESFPPPRFPQRNIPERTTLPPRRQNPGSQLVPSVAAEYSSVDDKPVQPRSYLVVDDGNGHEDTNPALFIARPPVQPKSPSLRWEIEQTLNSEQPQPPARATRNPSPRPHSNFVHSESVPNKSSSKSPEMPRRVAVGRRASDPSSPLAPPLPSRLPFSGPVPVPRRGSTPTSPPPLPSRELIHPTTQEEMHPPAPLRKRFPLPAISAEEGPPGTPPPPVPRRQRVGGGGSGPYIPQRTPTPENERTSPRGPSPNEEQFASTIVVSPPTHSPPIRDQEAGPPIPLRSQSAARQGPPHPTPHLRPLSNGSNQNRRDEHFTSRSGSSPPEAMRTSDTPQLPPKPSERLQNDMNYSVDSRPKIRPRVTKVNGTNNTGLSQPQDSTPVHTKPKPPPPAKPPIAKKPAPKHRRDNPPVDSFDRTPPGPPVTRPRPPVPPPKRW